MFTSRGRSLTIALIAGALTIFGAGGALAADAGAGSRHLTGGDAPGPTHPVCEGWSPLIGSAICPKPGD
jgi:hypothetical protein